MVAASNNGNGPSRKGKVVWEGGRRYVYVTKFWHWRAKRFLYASDYNKKAFKIPLG